jgi:hypothetical protein
MLKVDGFDDATVKRAIDELKANPYAGRNTFQAMFNLGPGRARRLAREVKAHLSLDPSLKQNAPGLDEIGVQPAPMTDDDQERMKFDVSDDEIAVEATLPMNRYSYAETIPHLLDAAEIDTDKWDVYRKVINRWGSRDNPCWQVKAWLKPVEADLYEQMIEAALETLRGMSPIVPSFEWGTEGRDDATHRRALEISIMDPHLGGIFYPPASEQHWTLESCKRLWHYGVQEVLNRAAPFGPFERILFFFGNDFMHADNVFHTTTAGTGQPEMAAIHHVATYGERMLIDTLNHLAEIAPVDVLFVPGNHSRWSEFMLARVLLNRFWNDERVNVNADPTPYKGWHYGCNLIGGEHGHSAAAIRLAAVMANEWPEAWAATKGGYREWHLGDQHRTGKGKPLIYEEQGVSVQGLPGLTPVNEWHKIKTFSRQKRVAATGFVWDYHGAKIAELPICLDGETGEPFRRVA